LKTFVKMITKHDAVSSWFLSPFFSGPKWNRLLSKKLKND